MLVAISNPNPTTTVHGYPYNRRANAARQQGDLRRELEILLEGVTRHADTPHTYDRSAALLEQSQRFEEALAVCDTWFLVPQRTRASGKMTEAKIVNRRARLLERLGQDPRPAQPTG